MGRPTNAERAARAAQAAAASNQAAQQAPSESVEQAPSLEPKEPQAQRNFKIGNEGREKALEEIEARQRKESGELEPTPEAKPEAKPVEAENPETAPEAPKVDPVESDAPKLVKVKVDGEELEVPQADIDEAGGIPAYRMTRAAENRLKKANETVASVKQAEATILQHLQSLAKPEKPQTNSEFIASKVDIIRFGTPEESAAALSEVIDRARTDPQEIENRAVTRMQRSVAIDNFKKEFHDVVSNPLLLRLAVSLENERPAKQGEQRDWQKFYREIGSEVRSVTGRPSQPSPTATTSDTPSQAPSDKEARKASIVNLPTAASRAEAPKEEKPQSRDDILNEMRKTRGIPVG